MSHILSWGWTYFHSTWWHHLTDRSTPPSLPLPSPVCPHFHSQMSPSPLLHRGPSEMPSPKHTTLESLTSDRPLSLCLLTPLFFLTCQLLKLIYYTMLWQLLHKPTDFSCVVHRSILSSWIVPAQLTLSQHLLRKNRESRCCSMESRKNHFKLIKSTCLLEYFKI